MLLRLGKLNLKTYPKKVKNAIFVTWGRYEGSLSKRTNVFVSYCESTNEQEMGKIKSLITQLLRTWTFYLLELTVFIIDEALRITSH